MERLPKEVTEFVVNLVVERGHLAYLEMNPDGLLLRWGGDLKAFGIDCLVQGLSVVFQVPFLNGILPIKERSLCVPLLRIDSEMCIHIHMYRGKTTDWILLEDKTVEAADLLRQLGGVYGVNA